MLTKVRREAAGRLRDAVMAELPPLRLDKARFFVEVMETAETGWGANGADQVRFLIANIRTAAGRAGENRVGRRIVPADAGAEGGTFGGLDSPNVGVR